jgi:hypothetical protein
MEQLTEFYELGALRLVRVDKVPSAAVEQTNRHTVIALSEDKSLAFFWARRVYHTEDNKQTYVEVTFTTPIKQGRETPIMVPPSIYLLSIKR